jgi:hypothetical protein
MGIGMSEIAAHSGLGPFDPYWTDDAPRPGRDRRAWGRRVALGLAAGVALVGVTALAPAPSNAPSPASAPAPAPVSGEIVDPTLAPIFTFETGDGARARYEARIDRATGARRDAYSLGALDGDAPALRVEMWKSANARGAGSLFVEIAEETAAFGAAVERLGISQIVTTSQGPVEWADLTLAGGRGKRTCVGFRLLARAGGGLHGVACATAGAKIDAGALSCLVDRLALTRAGREAGFADIVKSAAIRRPACRAAIG